MPCSANDGMRVPNGPAFLPRRPTPFSLVPFASFPALRARSARCLSTPWSARLFGLNDSRDARRPASLPFLASSYDALRQLSGRPDFGSPTRRLARWCVGHKRALADHRPSQAIACLSLPSPLEGLRGPGGTVASRHGDTARGAAAPQKFEN